MTASTGIGDIRVLESNGYYGSVVDVRGIARMQRRRWLNCLFRARCRPQAVLDWLDHQKSVGFSARLLNLPGFCRSTYSLG